MTSQKCESTSVATHNLTRYNTANLTVTLSIREMDQKSNSLDSTSRADELEERLIDFAVRAIRLCASLPKTPAGRHISGQILRSGTSPAPNYAEARGAESQADFIHKLRIVLKELMRPVCG